MYQYQSINSFQMSVSCREILQLTFSSPQALGGFSHLGQIIDCNFVNTNPAN